MARFDAARYVLERAIAERAFPGAIVEVGTDRDVLWRFATGRLTYDAGSAPVGDDTVYDLASLTKVLSTGALAMREIEDDRGCRERLREGCEVEPGPGGRVGRVGGRRQTSPCP